MSTHQKLFFRKKNKKKESSSYFLNGNYDSNHQISMSALQNLVNMMERVRMESTVTHVLAKTDILGSTAKQVSYTIS